MERPGAASAQGLHLISIGWERIQLSLVLRAVDGGDPPDAASLRLRRHGSRPREMAPTHVAVDASTGATTVWFNVVAGYRRRPLETGRWTLAGTSGAGIWITADAATVASAGRTFTFPTSPYRVQPGIGADGRTLSIEIDRSRDGGSAGGRRRRRWRWLIPQPIRRAGVRTVRRSRRMPRALLVAVLRRTVRRNGRRIVFASAGASELSSNLGVVRDRMIERGIDRDHDLIMLPGRRASTPGGIVRRVSRAFRAEVREIRLLTSADVVFVAGSLQRAVYRLDFDPDVRFIQLWHASGALKLVGYSRAGLSDGPDPWSRVHKTYSHAIVSSGYDVPFYAEAFGIPETRVIPTGIPRMDRFFDETRQAAARAAALARFPMAEGRRTILFAPTYRGLARSATYDYGQLDFDALHAVAVEQDAIVICKMHPFIRQPVPIPAAFQDRIVDGTRTKIDVNDLLCIVDLLITDYSSILFEYAVLGRPMLFFAYDLDEYAQERDFYVPFADFVPGRIVRTSDALVDAIRQHDYQLEKVSAFATRHFAHLDAGSTDRVIDLALAR